MFDKRKPVVASLVAAVCLSFVVVQAQQVADPDFRPQVGRAAFGKGRGPAVCVDEAHTNFHTATGRYAPFADVLTQDGYAVRGSAAKFTKEALAQCRVMVIANALGERNQNNWSLPIDPAYTDAEVAAVAEWVRGGGSLFLIVDHMPMPAANQKLADAFGVSFSNGFAMIPNVNAAMIFKRDDRTLADSPVTRGRNKDERVDAVATFTGSAFRLTRGGDPVLVFGPQVLSLEPETAWQFTEKTPRVDVRGWLQGATLKHGKGRVAVFGEAAMFTAQLAGPNKLKVGMNAPEAPRNAQLLLNVMHWLTSKL